MGFSDEPIRSVVADVRPGILHLLKHHQQSHGSAATLKDLVDRPLRLNPEVTEVRKAGDGLTVSGRGT